MNRFLFNGASVPIRPFQPIPLSMRYEVGKNCWQDMACTIPATEAGDPVAVWKPIGAGEDWKFSDVLMKRPTLELASNGKMMLVPHGEVLGDFET